MSYLKKARNIAKNINLHEQKVRSHGLGRRERRRLLSGKRIPATQADRMFLVDEEREDLIPKD